MQKNVEFPSGIFLSNAKQKKPIDLGSEKFVLASDSNLSRYALSFSNLMKWIIKMEPTSRWILYIIFGKHVLCIETEWRWMFVSNRYKVNFVVQRRYATWQVQIEKETCFSESFY